MTKPKTHGGHREGAGRPEGAPNKLPRRNRRMVQPRIDSDLFLWLVEKGKAPEVSAAYVAARLLEEIAQQKGWVPVHPLKDKL